MGREEDKIVALIRAAFAQSDAVVGIGDDAAVVRMEGAQAITSDMLVEDVDFTAETPIESIARKALASNLSDLAAMGARPTHFLLNLGVPSAYRDRLQQFVRALAAAAAQHEVSLVGGDLSSAAKFIVSITAFGSVARPLLRSGARSGDRVYLSRPIGGAAAGFQLFNKGWRLDEEGRAAPPSTRAEAFALGEFAAAVLRQFFEPLPETRLGLQLANDLATSCIDLSDGLSTDLRRLCEASGVAAVVEWEKIPLFPDLHVAGPRLGVSVEDAALHGGEEYALLFTSRLREYELSTKLGRPVYAIGRMESGSGITLIRNGVDVPLADHGFDHFR